MIPDAAPTAVVQDEMFNAMMHWFLSLSGMTNWEASCPAKASQSSGGARLISRPWGSTQTSLCGCGEARQQKLGEMHSFNASQEPYCRDPTYY